MILFNFITGTDLLGACSKFEIRGPLLLDCNGGQTTYHYYIQDPLISGPPTVVTWAVIPSSAGTISNPNYTSVDVTWSGTNNMGYLVFSFTNVSGVFLSDTLKPQICCTAPFPMPQIKDFDDLNLTGPDVANIFPNATWDAINSVVHVNGGDIFIEGQMNFRHTNILFDDCHLFMGAGAVIYGRRGSNLPVPGIHLNKTTVRGVCQMWQGFRPNENSYILFELSEVDDAEYAIGINSCLVDLRLISTNFYRNTIVISNSKSDGATAFDNPPLAPSLIQNCKFDGTQPILLPNFNCQSGKPNNQRSIAGMYFIGLGGNFPTIPFHTSSNLVNTFTGLQYGIYGINSNIDVLNCHFNIIQPIDGDLGKPFASAIYSINTTGNVNLNVGDADISVPLINRHNEFNDCYRGITCKGNINSNILSNVFIHNPFSLTAPSYPSGINISINNANNCTLKINSNHHIEHEIIPNGMAFNSTGIYISNPVQFYNNIEILGNVIDNNRIGIYLNNIRGRLLTADLHVWLNTINSTIPDILLGSQTHFGMMLSNIEYGRIETNIIDRSVPLSQLPDFDTKMYGINAVQCANSTIHNNHIHRYGTAMRYVSSCIGTDLLCNELDNCIQGISFANASMSDQGSANNPWDNVWTGFPTPTNTTYNRADGAVVPLRWFNRDPSNDINFSNDYSPEPVDINYIQSFPNQTGLLCGQAAGDGVKEQLLDIVNNSITYSGYTNEDQYINEEYAYQTLLRDSALVASENDFVQYIISRQNSNLELFNHVDDEIESGNYAAALLALNIITDENAIEHNKHFTKEIALQLASDPGAIITQNEWDELEEIAWTNVWQGGDGVFTARHILEAEVFDVEKNLRVKHNVKNTASPIRISVYPNPVKEKAVVYHNLNNGTDLLLIVNDFTGKSVLKTDLRNNVVDVSKLDQGLYTFSFYYSGLLQSSAKIAILK